MSFIRRSYMEKEIHYLFDRTNSSYVKNGLNIKLDKENLPVIHDIKFNVEDGCIKSIDTNGIIIKIRRKRKDLDAEQ